MTHEIINGDCLVELPKLAERGVVVDACITDPPYGTTACAWDAVIPFEPMWANLKRLVKPSGAIVLFGSQPFTSALVMSNPRMFKYEWVADKGMGTGHLDAKRRPLKRHDNVCVFYTEQPTYNPQFERGRVHRNGALEHNERIPTVYGAEVSTGVHETDIYYPTSIIKAKKESQDSLVHPTQKSLELMRYLVRTYTNPGDTVLDFTAGSFTTGVACVIEGRNFIGIEQSLDYCRIGEARMKRARGEWAEVPKLNRRQIEMPLFGTP